MAAAPSTTAETLLYFSGSGSCAPPTPPSYPYPHSCQHCGSRALRWEAKLCAGYPAALWLPPGSPLAGPGEERQGKPQPTEVLQAHPVDSGDPGESPSPYSGPYIRCTIALIGTPLAMAYPQKTLPTPRIDFPPSAVIVAWEHAITVGCNALVAPTELKAPQRPEGAVSDPAPHP